MIISDWASSLSSDAAISSFLLVGLRVQRDSLFSHWSRAYPRNAIILPRPSSSYSEKTLQSQGCFLKFLTLSELKNWGHEFVSMTKSLFTRSEKIYIERLKHVQDWDFKEELSQFGAIIMDGCCVSYLLDSCLSQSTFDQPALHWLLLSLVLFSVQSRTHVTYTLLFPVVRVGRLVEEGATDPIIILRMIFWISVSF